MSFWSRLLRGSAGDQYHRGIRLFNEGQLRRSGRARSRKSSRAAAPTRSPSSARSTPPRRTPSSGSPTFTAASSRRRAPTSTSRSRENPHYPDLYFYLGVVEHHAGNFAAAIEHLDPRRRAQPRIRRSDVPARHRAARRRLLRQRGGDVRPRARAGAPHAAIRSPASWSRSSTRAHFDLAAAAGAARAGERRRRLRRARCATRPTRSTRATTSAR